jgi:hypothetical protein
MNPYLQRIEASGTVGLQLLHVGMVTPPIRWRVIGALVWGGLLGLLPRVCW